jgi:TolB protein
MHLRRIFAILPACAAVLAGLGPRPARGAATADRPPIVINAPDFRPLPIAVAAFAGEGDARGAAGDATSAVRSDLALSGLFDVLDPKGFLADPDEGLAVTAVAFPWWASCTSTRSAPAARS